MNSHPFSRSAARERANELGLGVRTNNPKGMKSKKKGEILNYLHIIRENAPGEETAEASRSSGESRQDAPAIEGNLSSLTTDTQRAKDFILQARDYKSRYQLKTMHSGDDESSRSMEVHSAHPLHETDETSTVSKSSTAATASADDLAEKQRKDDPWKAAERGDLTALKQFHLKKINWLAKDAFQNIPLYYACHAGAIKNINVVSYLMEVTPLDDTILERCRLNAINYEVLRLIDERKKEPLKIHKTNKKSSEGSDSGGSVGGFSFSEFLGLTQSGSIDSPHKTEDTKLIEPHRSPMATLNRQKSADVDDTKDFISDSLRKVHFLIGACCTSFGLLDLTTIVYFTGAFLRQLKDV